MRQHTDQWMTLWKAQRALLFRLCLGLVVLVPSLAYAASLGNPGGGQLLLAVLPRGGVTGFVLAPPIWCVERPLTERLQSASVGSDGPASRRDEYATPASPQSYSSR